MAHRRKWYMWLVVAVAAALLTLALLNQALLPPTGQILAGHDLRGQFYPWAEHVQQRLLAGEWPWWDPFHMGGYPMSGNPQIGFFYPPAWPALLLSPRLGWGLYLAFHLWWAATGMAWFMRRRGARWGGAALAALTYAFGGFMAARLQAGHVGMIASAAWVPWLLATYDWAVEQRSPWAALLAGLPWGLLLLAGNLNVAFYAGLIWLAYALQWAVHGGRWGLALRQLTLAGLVGVALGAVQLGSTAALVLRSARSAGTLATYGARWSLPPVHLLAFLVPGYFGIPGRTGWWSVENFEELTYYVGALPWLILPWAWRRKRSRWYLVVALLGLLLALGTYGVVYPLLYDLLPFFRLGRAPARAAFLIVFAASAWLGEAVSDWLASPMDARRQMLASWRPWWWAGLVAAVLALAATGAVFAAVHPSEQGGRLWHQAAGWATWLAVWAAGGGLLHLALSDREAHRRLGTWALGALVVFDLWTLLYPLVRTQAAAVSPLWQDARALIGETTQMVLPWSVQLEAQNDAGRVGLRSALGYNPIELAAYQDLAMSVPDPRSTAYDLLGVSHVVSPNPLEARFMEGAQGLVEIGHTDHVWVYSRPSALSVARLVYAAQVVPDSTAAVARVHDAGVAVSDTAILSEPPPCELTAGNGQARIVSMVPGRWVIETDSTAPALLVLAENAYPGWQVSVDGQPATALTAYTTLRAVCVPSGAHTVTWTYWPPWLVPGLVVSGLALLIVVAAMWRVWRCEQGDAAG